MRPELLKPDFSGALGAPRPATTTKPPRNLAGFVECGRERIRTSDPHRVKVLR